MVRLTWTLPLLKTGNTYDSICENGCLRFIVSYHLQVGASTCTARVPDNKDLYDPTVTVPVVSMKLVESTQLLPLQSKMVTVQLDKDHKLKGTFLIKPLDECKLSAELQLGSYLVNFDKKDLVIVLLTNSTSLTQ